MFVGKPLFYQIRTPLVCERRQQRVKQEFATDPIACTAYINASSQHHGFPSEDPLPFAKGHWLRIALQVTRARQRIVNTPTASFPSKTSTTRRHSALATHTNCFTPHRSERGCCPMASKVIESFSHGTASCTSLLASSVALQLSTNGPEELNIGQ
jgi:hypothetical protein